MLGHNKLGDENDHYKQIVPGPNGDNFTLFSVDPSYTLLNIASRDSFIGDSISAGHHDKLAL